MESISCAVLFPSAPRLSHALHFCGFTLAFISAAALMMNAGCVGEQPRPCPALFAVGTTLVPLASVTSADIPAEEHCRGSRICPTLQCGWR